MSASRALAFGDLDAGLWGIAWTPVADAQIPVAVGAGPEAEVLAATLTDAGEEEAWRLEGDGLELIVSPSARPVAAAGSAPGLSGFDQLCRIEGQVKTGADERVIGCLGWRGTRDGPLELDRIDSFRQVSAWFAPDEGLALVALRPRGARGQESDLVAASVLGPEPAFPVTDPRLSTTYTGAGLPARAGVELWVEEAPSQNGDPEQSPELASRRAAGEAVGSGLDWAHGGFSLHGAPFRWHSRGREGAGVYLLGRRQ